jgi:hypothetical protein
MSTVPNPTTPNWLLWMSRKKQETAYILFGLAVVALGLGIWLLWQHRDDWMPEIVFLGGFIVVAVAGAVWYTTRENDTLSDVLAARILVLGVGALFGFGIQLVIVARTIGWWSYITSMDKWHGHDSWRIIYWVVANLLSVGIIFFSLMLGRQEEQSHPTLRRIIHGYGDIALVLWLTLAVLIVVNVIAFLYVPAASDWTKTGLYTLDESQSQNILKALDAPVKIIIMARYPGDPITDEVSKLVDTCRNYTNKIEFPVTTYYKDRNRQLVDELVNQHSLSHDVGVLVYYGEDRKKWQFIPEKDLYAMSGMRGDQQFKGEDALMTAFRKLEQDKPAVYYFIQGHGELSFSGGGRPDRSDSSLKQKLEKYDQIKGLILDPNMPADPDTVVSATVPDDAAAVVIAGYSSPFQPKEVEALRKYAKGEGREGGPGKLLILLGTVVREGKMVPSGLEPLLDEYGVKVGDNHVMAFPVDDANAPPIVATSLVSQTAEHKLAVSLERVALIRLSDVRTVEAKAGGVGAYRVEPLLVVVPRSGLCKLAWAETDLNKRADQILREKFLDKNDPQAIDIEKFAAAYKDPNYTQQLPVAVTVADSSALPPGHPGVSAEGKPHMVVIGSSQIASDELVGPEGSQYYAVVASSLGYLREKPEMIGIPAKAHDKYMIGPRAAESYWSMIMQPMLFMLCGIFGLGLCVWVIRQR